MCSMQGHIGVMRTGSGLQSNVLKIRALPKTSMGGARMPVLPQAMRKQTPRLHRRGVTAEKQKDSHQEQPHKVHKNVHAPECIDPRVACGCKQHGWTSGSCPAGSSMHAWMLL